MMMHGFLAFRIRCILVILDLFHQPGPCLMFIRPGSFFHRDTEIGDLGLHLFRLAAWKGG